MNTMYQSHPWTLRALQHRDGTWFVQAARNEGSDNARIWVPIIGDHKTPQSALDAGKNWLAGYRAGNADVTTIANMPWEEHQDLAAYVEREAVEESIDRTAVELARILGHASPNAMSLVKAALLGTQEQARQETRQELAQRLAADAD